MSWREQIIQTFRERRAAIADEFRDDPDYQALSREHRFEFASSVATMSLMRDGFIPVTFVHSLTCKQCGVVPTDHVIGEPVIACVWCNNNAKPEIDVAFL